jgi:hypothetical protein
MLLAVFVVLAGLYLILVRTIGALSNVGSPEAFCENCPPNPGGLSGALLFDILAGLVVFSASLWLWRQRPATGKSGKVAPAISLVLLSLFLSPAAYSSTITAIGTQTRTDYFCDGSNWPYILANYATMAGTANSLGASYATPLDNCTAGINARCNVGPNLIGDKCGNSATATFKDYGAGNTCTRPDSPFVTTQSCTGTPTLSIPNAGQRYSRVDISTDVYPYGYLQTFVNGAFIAGSGNSEVSLFLGIYVLNSTGGVAWSATIISDDQLCGSGGDCSPAPITYKTHLTPSWTNIQLKAGDSYTVELIGVVNSKASAIGTANSQAYSCLQDNLGDCGGSNAPLAALSGNACPAGSDSINGVFYCYFVKWNYATYTVYAPDYSVSANPTTITTAPGGTVGSTAYVASVNGYVGTVSLSYVAPPGISVTPGTSSIALFGGSVSTPVTIVVATTVAPASYTVTLNARDTVLGLTHSTPIYVIVDPPPAGGGGGGIRLL